MYYVSKDGEKVNRKKKPFCKPLISVSVKHPSTKKNKKQRNYYLKNV